MSTVRSGVIAVTMPKVAMGMNEGTVTAWLKAEGELVRKGEPLLSIETEKTTYDVDATGSGVLHIVVSAGTTVPIGTLLATLSADGGGGELTDPADPDGRAGRVKVSPLARKLAAEKGIELTAVQGTGPGERIKRRDIERFEQEQRSGASAGAALDVPRATSAAPSVTAPASPPESGVRARIPLTGARKAIAERTMRALASQAHVTQSTEVEIDALLAARATFVARAEQLGTRVSLLAFVAKAVALAARRVPIVNARVVGDEIVVYDEVHLGLVVSVPGDHELTTGLLVPVVRNAEAKGIVQLDREMRAAAETARAGRCSPADVSGSTLTLSSAAGFAPGWSATTPILWDGQALIVQPGTAEQRAVVRDGQIVIRTMLPLSLTFDHRVLDGEPLGRFTRALHDLLQHPELLAA